MRYKTVVRYRGGYGFVETCVLKRSWTKEAAQQFADEIVEHGFLRWGGASFVTATEIREARVYTARNRIVSVHPRKGPAE